MAMKFPYGISDFYKLITEGYFGKLTDGGDA
jgi:hypothetical protein